MRRTALATIGMALILLVSGCGTRRTTDTPRTASEQMLVSAAVSRSVEQLDFSPMKGLKVFVSDALVDRVDKAYVIASVRAAAWRAGCVVVEKAEEADFVLELRSGAVGLDRTEYVFGVPASQIPGPFGGASIPEVALFKTVKQEGGSWLAFVVYRRGDRTFQYSAGPAFGWSRQRAWWLFGGGPGIIDDLTEVEKRAATQPAWPLTPLPPASQPATQPATQTAPEPTTRPARPRRRPPRPTSVTPLERSF